MRSYNRLGAAALGDLRHQNPGKAALLDELQQALLLQALREPAPDGGLWNGRKVADYLSQLLGVSISRQQGWEYLKQMELRLRVPRSQHQEADEDDGEAWKKKLQQEVEQIQQQYPDADVELWCEDEHRIGLQPLTRRVWAEAGQAPIAKVNWKREWLWLYALVCPHTGETYWWILPHVNHQIFSRVLQDFADHFGVGNNKRIVLPLDRAGWHKSRAGTSTPRHSLGLSTCLLSRITASYRGCGHW